METCKPTLIQGDYDPYLIQGGLTIRHLYREDERFDTYTGGTSDPTLNISRKQTNVFQLEHK